MSSYVELIVGYGWNHDYCLFEVCN